MTICQILLTLNMGGAEMVAVRLARELRSQYRFVFVCLDNLGVLGEQLQAEGFAVHVVGRRPGLAGIDWRCAWRLGQILRLEQVDLLHAHQYSPFFYALAARLLHRRPPLLFTEHGRFHPDLPSRKRIFANRVLLERRDRIVGVGEAVRQSLIDIERIPANRIGVIYNGIDADQFAPDDEQRLKVRQSLGLSGDDFVAIQVARLDPLKDHTTAIAAIEQLSRQHKQVKLVLVGDGPLAESIRQLVKQKQLEQHILLLGSRHDIPHLLAAANVFLLTSISEGIPLAIIEAMAAGLPVVATAVGGTPEVVDPERTGLLVPPRDSHAVAGALLRLLQDSRLCHAMGGLGRERAMAKFSQTTMHKAYRRAYEDLAAKLPVRAEPVERTTIPKKNNGQRPMFLKGPLLWCFVFLWAPVRNFWRRIRGRSHTTVLVYHRVTDEFRDAMTVGVEQFRQQLELLTKKYDVIDLRQFLLQRGKPRRRPAVVVTFDDGYADNLFAAKLLSEAGVRATFFISTGIVGTTDAFEHDLSMIGQSVPTLSWNAVRRMAKMGFEIGNHTTQHANLAAMDTDDAVDDIARAAEDLRRELGESAAQRWLAYPFGRREHMTDRLRRRLPEVGIDCCLSAYGGTNPPDFDPLNVVRQGVDYRFSLLAFRAAIEGWECQPYCPDFSESRPWWLPVRSWRGQQDPHQTAGAQASNGAAINQSDCRPTPTAHDIYFSPLAETTRLQEQRERNFFGTIRQQNGTYKFTYANRLGDLNELIERWLPDGESLDVMDVAASSGTSGLAWSESLAAAGIQHRMTLGDVRIHCSLVSLGKYFRVLLDESGYPLQFDLLGRAIPNPPPLRKRWSWPLLAVLGTIARWTMLRSGGETRSNKTQSRLSRTIRCQPVTLMSPRVVGLPNIHIVEDDLVSGRDRSGRFHVVRAANILNRDYFDEPTLRTMIRNLRRRLLPGGLLAVCTTDNDIRYENGGFLDAPQAANHGTLFALRDGHLEVVDRLGNGSAVEALVLSTNEVAMPAY